MLAGIDLAIVVPFHNEERHLPTAIESLCNQEASEVPVVLVDNGSRDGSAAVVRRCPEVQSGRWVCIEAPAVGKFFAMAAGVDFCTQRLRARHIGFLDADSFYTESGWLHASLRILQGASSNLGYIYSPYYYFDLAHLPSLAAAYRACAAVEHALQAEVGWFANSAAAIYSAPLLARFFRSAAVTTELGLRCSLLALSAGLAARLNSIPVMTSARRIIANADNLRDWCFYTRQFYVTKDINSSDKIRLDAPRRTPDLAPELVGLFFRRQAVKFACRNLIPLALFDRDGQVAERLRAALGLDVRELVLGVHESLLLGTDLVLTDRFETLLAAIEQDPSGLALAAEIERRMRSRYETESEIVLEPTTLAGDQLPNRVISR